VGRLIAFIPVCALLAACQSSAAPVATPTPSPSPHTPATAAVLQPGEVPAGLTACANSGPIASYIASLDPSSPVTQRVASGWADLQHRGAVEGAIALYADDTSSCTAELAASSKGKSMASFVARFGDEGQADRAWSAGVLGFVPPAPGESPPGFARGRSTGLGQSSWTYDRTPVRLACWRTSAFVALIVVTNLDAAGFTAATAAVDARLH
jgi:hypothetical protein